MITAWDIYWITRLDDIGGFTGFMGFVLGITFFVAFTFTALMNDNNAEKEDVRGVKRIAIWTGILSCLVIPIALLLPSTKEACVIYLIPKIVNNEQVQKVPENFAKLLNVKMEEWINESIMDKKQGDK